MNDWVWAATILICGGGIITLNVLNVLEKAEEANTITIGSEQYPQCQLTVQLAVRKHTMQELGDMGMWDWMAQCVVDAELKRQNDE